MFTVGIFTTHIPYLAFVFFYAFFFLTGFQKISEEETGTTKKFTQHKLILTTANQNVNDSGDFDFDDTNLWIVPKTGRMFYLHRKTQFRHPLKVPIQFNFFGFLNFSRPPPAI